MCRQIGVSEATYYTWKKKFGDLAVTEFKHLKMLEKENDLLAAAEVTTPRGHVLRLRGARRSRYCRARRSWRFNRCIGQLPLAPRTFLVQGDLRVLYGALLHNPAGVAFDRG